MLRREIAEGERRTELEARTRIGAVHDRVHIVAAGVKLADRGPATVRTSPVRVGEKARRGSEVARIDRDGIERRLFDRRNARVWLVVRIAEIALIGIAAAADLGIDSMAGAFVVPRQCRGEGFRIDAERGGERADRLPPDEIPAAYMFARRQRERFYSPESVTPQELPIADQIRRDAGAVVVAAEHRLDELVVGLRLVGEAAPAAVDGDHAGLPAISHGLGKHAL